MPYQSKYKSKKVVTPQGTFDSKKEYQRYCELKALQKAGEISELQRQVEFELVPSVPLHEPRPNGKRKQRREYPVKYIADFVYKQDGKQIVEDTKGFRTAEYKIKRKLMLWVHDIQIQEV